MQNIGCAISPNSTSRYTMTTSRSAGCVMEESTVLKKSYVEVYFGIIESDVVSSVRRVLFRDRLKRSPATNHSF